MTYKKVYSMKDMAYAIGNESLSQFAKQNSQNANFERDDSPNYLGVGLANAGAAGVGIGALEGGRRYKRFADKYKNMQPGQARQFGVDWMEQDSRARKKFNNDPARAADAVQNRATRQSNFLDNPVQRNYERARNFAKRPFDTARDTYQASQQNARNVLDKGQNFARGQRARSAGSAVSDALLRTGGGRLGLGLLGATGAYGGYRALRGKNK